MKILMWFLPIVLLGCETRNDGRITAASSFTERFARSRFADWHIRAKAAGEDCAVLLVETAMIMDESMIEAMHYGAGAYDVYTGGVQQFSRERAFRAVVYRDPSLRTWTYGAVNVTEAETLRACR
ncbi:MAG TPA: hypothetical protein VGQ36_04960 [Thermoanaerobaculia bacterium]|nr:hypothetical protein [Thermoanaerobaculia bacterium]